MLVQVIMLLIVEVRASFLSYEIQKIQRNKYITFMLIYATIALMVYLRLLNMIYNKNTAS